MDKSVIRQLYHELLEGWNERDAAKYAGFFAKDGRVVGFDGSQMNGRDEIAAEIGRIFEDHVTAAYFAKVREVRFLSPDVALLRGVAGMVPPGGSDINPAANAIQSLVAVKEGESWRVALFHNTPAQFHGRPELVEALTGELRELL